MVSPNAVIAMNGNEMLAARWLLLGLVAVGTYLAGVDLLTTESVVVGTHDGCFSCGTGAGVGFLVSIVFNVQTDDFGKVGSSGSCDLEEASSAGKRVAAWQMMEKGLAVDRATG